MVNTKQILVACDTLETGGAETFAMRMARYYSERGHHVTLFSVLGDRIDMSLVKQNAGNIEVLTFLPPKVLNWIIYKIDALLYRIGFFSGLRRRLTILKCRRIIENRNIQVVHTNMFASVDIFNHAALRNDNVKIVHSVHADLLGFAYYSISGKEARYNKYHYYCIDKLLPKILKRVDYIVATAEMHLRIFKAWPLLDSSKLVKIYNPVDRLESKIDGIKRTDIGIPDNSFVFGSMARTIPEKGWEELIQAFLLADIPDSFLLLIGDGSFLPYLKSNYESNKNVVFVGNQANPLPYLKLIDVGISSSYFWESLPTAIIDFLSLSKPVICTDNAESSRIISSENGPAGLIVPLRKDSWDVIEEGTPLDKTDLMKALREIYNNNELRNRLTANTSHAFSKFDKKHLIDQYEELFN